MKAIQAIREERNDVFEIWDIVKSINEATDKVVKTDMKIEEVTVVDLESRIANLQEQIKKEEEKLALILAL